MSEQRVPQAAPGLAYTAHQAEIDRAICDVLASGRYVLGPEVSAFEREFAAYVGVSHGVGVASGTDALELALRAVGIGPGDAVYTVSHTAVATVVAIERTGALPVLVDVERDTYTMDPESLASAVRTLRLPAGTRPAAVVPVHLYGQMADMPALATIAGEAGLLIIEDCAQAHGASLDGRSAGTWGLASSFSFYPTKNLGAFGDGGLVATDDARVAERVRELREYGWRERYVSTETGVNSRLDEIQAAILRIQLRHLDDGNARRRMIAAAYNERLKSTTIEWPRVRRGARHVYHQYVVEASNRQELMSSLHAQQIDTAIHYPQPVHTQPAYAGRLITTPDLSATEALVDRIISLPMFPELTDTQQERVKTALGLADVAPASL